MANSGDPIEDIYIFNVQPLLIDDRLVWDVFYLVKDSTTIHCIRIFNIELSFIVERLPGLTGRQFQIYMKSKLPNAKRIEFKKDLRECEYFYFERHRLYAEVFANSPVDLAVMLKTIKAELVYYYTRIDDEFIKRMANCDKAFYECTETPVRESATTTSLTNSVYNLSTKYNIPLVGGCEVNTGYLTEEFPNECLPIMSCDRFNIHGLDFKYLTQCLKRNDKIDFKRNLRLLAYDIETYTRENLNPMVRANEIFCIGTGIFDITSETPLESYCFISKDFNDITIDEPDESGPTKSVSKVYRIQDEFKKLKSSSSSAPTIYIGNKEYASQHNATNPNALYLEISRITAFGRRAYSIKNEYSSYKPPSQTSDTAIYVICRNEHDLLDAYIACLKKHKPQVTTGFNTYGFDDEFVYKRCLINNLEDNYLQCFSFYNLEEMKDCRWYKPFAPTYRDNVRLKIDSNFYTNKTVSAWNVLQTDIYKMILKDDAKRFTQQGFGNLNTMLRVYEVKNPFNKQALSKTDMGIQEMFDDWDKSHDIYRIALYCRQDAWITGTLMIHRAKLSDLMEIANTSFVSLRDAIFKADGHKVNMAIIAEAYSQGFANKDEPSDQRGDLVSGKSVVKLGGKHFDTRTIVGGCVRNLKPGLNFLVTAGDFSSMYPSQKEANMCDSSSRIPDIILQHPEWFNITVIDNKQITDMYGDREIRYLEVDDEDDEIESI